MHKASLFSLLLTLNIAFRNVSVTDKRVYIELRINFNVVQRMFFKVDIRWVQLASMEQDQSGAIPRDMGACGMKAYYTNDAERIIQREVL